MGDPRERCGVGHSIKILVVISHYLPGYKAGGPIRTIANMVDWLGDEYIFYVVTSDRDLGSRHPYATLKQGAWQPVGKAQVLYLAPARMHLFAWCRLLNSLDYDLLYLNSFFSNLSMTTMFARWLGLIPSHPTVLAPRGQFSPGALALKGFKKHPYIFLARCLGLYDDIIWHASSNYEANDLRSVFGTSIDQGTSPIWVAPNLPNRALCKGNPAGERTKQAGTAKIVFLSRIARKKNLDVALRFLSHLTSEVRFDIYGPIEDASYWQECQALIDQLPENIQVSYSGDVPPDQAVHILSQYHLLLLPTRGENFGHVILESLCAGCPVLTSDQTPWRDLADKHAGWDIPLPESARFHGALEELVSMDNSTFQHWSQSAREYGRAFAQNASVIDANRELFRRALGR
jgi:glycosyltransferase involved in cell wall biosynthesis